MIHLHEAAERIEAWEFSELSSRGRTLAAKAKRSDREEGMSLLLAALRRTHVKEDEYVRAADALADAFEAIGRPREALSIAWYTGSARASAAVLSAVPPIDRARTLLQTASEASREPVLRAAGMLADAGHRVRAALAYERAGDWATARTLWSRLAASLGGSGLLYESALAHFDLARAARRAGDEAAARTAGLAGMHLCEEAADRFEREGMRERAYDCLQVLIAIGHETGTFEHALEGYVNAVRILRGDHLRKHARALYDEAIDAATRAGELVAAATLARELAAFARGEGEIAAANHASLLEADTWIRVARERSRGPAGAENALLAAVQSLADLGQLGRVGALYEELGRVAETEKRRAYFARAAARYQGARDARLALPDERRKKERKPTTPDVWHVDLLEWEAQGSASEATAEVLLDRRSYAEVTRRRALTARLVALAVETDAEAEPSAHVLLCEALAPLELYAVLAPLERLAAHGDASVRLAAIRALSRFLYKRTFATVRPALDDADPEVARAAADAVEKLAFPHAIEPLHRVVRTARSRDARASALRALGRIEHAEAAELLLSLLSSGDAADRKVIVAELTASRGRVFLDVARRAAPDLDPVTRKHVVEVFRARSVPLLRVATNSVAACTLPSCRDAPLLRCSWTLAPSPPLPTRSPAAMADDGSPSSCGSSPCLRTTAS